MNCAALPIAPPKGRVTSPYGWRNGRAHVGVDIGAPEGTPVYAMRPGKVVVSAPSGQLERYGNVIVLEHAPSLYSLSAHLRTRDVRAGELVHQGEQLGTVGRTQGTRADPALSFGSSGAHLHLEFLTRWPPRGKGLDRIDPGLVLRDWGVIVPSAGPLTLASTCDANAFNTYGLPDLPNTPAARATSRTHIPSSSSSPSSSWPTQPSSSTQPGNSWAWQGSSSSSSRALVREGSPTRVGGDGGAMLPLLLLLLAWTSTNS